MYTLKEIWLMTGEEEPIEGWDGEMLCTESNAEKSARFNRTQGMADCYLFTLVLAGSIKIIYSGHHMTIEAGELMIHSPGLQGIVESVSDDYRSMVLGANTRMVLDSPAARHMVRVANAPVMSLDGPHRRLNPEEAGRMEARMRDIQHVFLSQHPYRTQVLQQLLSVFLFDVQATESVSNEQSTVSTRTEELFFRFIQMLPHHFLEHRDVAFYASQLNISAVYLSRIVRQVSNRTVGDYINQMLAMEAAFLLRDTDHTVAQVADRLGFADGASFCKFFVRMKGISPRVFREG